MAETEEGWVAAGGGYHLRLQGDRLVARNPTGKVLASVSKELRESEVGRQLLSLREWMEEHERECLEEVERWMLRSIPVPLSVVRGVWADDAWRAALENAILAPVTPDGHLDLARAGFLRGLTERGIALVDLDGETVRLECAAVGLPHPVLLDSLEDFRAMAAEMEFRQGLSQLFRETFRKGEAHKDEEWSVNDFSGGAFDSITDVMSVCRKQNLRVRAGYATTRIWEDGQMIEARFYVGSGDPYYETETGSLEWVDKEQDALPLKQVGRVAFSEGMRMASAVYARRKVEEASHES